MPRIMHTGKLKGTLYCNLDNTSNYNNQKAYKYRKVLQASMKTGEKFKNLLCGLSKYTKRVLSSFSVCIEGSMTVEAAFVLPILLFSVLEILSLLQGLTVYSGMLVALQNISTPVSVYGYVYEMLETEGEKEIPGLGIVSSYLFSELYLKKKMQDELRDTDYEKYIVDKGEGISFVGSYVNADEVCVLTNYKIKPIISLTGRTFRMSNQLYLKTWNGYRRENEEKEGYVYITEYGTVYHLTMDCTHLKITIQTVPVKSLDAVRNEYGQKYEACDKCVVGEEQDIYYVSEKGKKFHEQVNCSGIKRTVTCVPESSVEDWPICSHCNKGS